MGIVRRRIDESGTKEPLIQSQGLDRILVQLPGVDAANFDVLYPLQTLKPIASLLRSRVQSDIIEDDVSWKDKLENAILEIPLDLKATLSQPIVNILFIDNKSSPSINIFPAVASVSLDMHRSNVDFPEPDNPMTTIISPF